MSAQLLILSALPWFMYHIFRATLCDSTLCSVHLLIRFSIPGAGHSATDTLTIAPGCAIIVTDMKVPTFRVHGPRHSIAPDPLFFYNIFSKKIEVAASVFLFPFSPFYKGIGPVKGYEFRLSLDYIIAHFPHIVKLFLQQLGI